jgi:7-carboxy-7-deazaguanine synthase
MTTPINKKNILHTVSIPIGTIPVMEAFYTVQGEGHHTGKASYFIRLAGCDVGCTWCDVKESWDVTPSQFKNIHQLVEEASGVPSRLAVITGGEPFIYDLEELINQLHGKGFRVHIETSGAYPVSGTPDWICVSPKKFKAPLPETLQKADELKIIIFNKSDFAWGEEHLSYVNHHCKLFLQPEFGKSAEMLPLMVEYVKANPQWQISLQTHKFIGIP